MILKLDELRCPRGRDRRSWRPFEPTVHFRADWWDRVPYVRRDPWFIQVLLQGAELARVKLDSGFTTIGYPGAPELGAEAVEIQYIEVAADHRCKGVGTEVVRQLRAGYPECRFLALSADTDRFWAGLGWHRYDHCDGPAIGYPLFLQPESR